MLSESSYYELGLDPVEAISVLAPGWTIHCLDGRLWLTEEGGPDIWLRAGESVRLTRPGRTVIESAGAASLRMAPPPSVWRGLMATGSGVLRALATRLVRRPSLAPIAPPPLPRRLGAGGGV
jgi:hypothetical protein